jgi:hypothetical protein
VGKWGTAMVQSMAWWFGGLDFVEKHNRGSKRSVRFWVQIEMTFIGELDRMTIRHLSSIVENDTSVIGKRIDIGCQLIIVYWIKLLKYLYWIWIYGYTYN